MTDHTKQPLDLLTRLRMSYAGKYSPLQVEAADAIESLQEKNALLEGTLESRERNITELQAENERLKIQTEAQYESDGKQIRELQAKLDALEKQELTVLKPLIPCVCHNDIAKRYCKNKGKCSYFEAHEIGGIP